MKLIINISETDYNTYKHFGDKGSYTERIIANGVPYKQDKRPKGKWKLVEHGKDIDLECPFCGYKRGNLSYGYTMEEVLKDIAEDDTMLTKFCEMCGADLR